MDDTRLYDVKAFHFDIDEIRRLSGVGAPEDELESVQMQALAEDILNSAQHPSYRLAPAGWLPGSGAERLQALSHLADFAYANVPMYRELYRQVGFEPGAIRRQEDFEALPVLTRAVLNSWCDDDRLALGRKAEDTYFVGTSGSSGKSLKVYYDQHAAIVETLESFQQYASYLGGTLPADRWIYNIHMSRGWMSSLNGRYRTFTLNEIPSHQALIAHFEQLRPVILCALPSHLWELAPIGDLTRFGIRAISTNSEQSSRVERDQLSRIFAVPVLDEYSSVELGVIAYECKSGHYHVNEDGLHIELLGDEGGFGRVVATDLRSWVMPLIRYDQGDLARLDTTPGHCQCTRPGQRFVEIRGRADDYFLRADGSKVSSATLLNLVDTLFTGPDSTLREFRLVQQAADKVLFEYVPHLGQALPAQIGGQLSDALTQHLGDSLQISLACLEQLSQPPSYKRKKVIRAF